MLKSPCGGGGSGLEALSPGAGVAADLERLARAEQRLDELEKDMGSVMRELGGVANGNGHASVRTRLHKLENNDDALRLVEQALREVRTERRSVVSGWLGYAIVFCAGVGALGTVISTIILLRGGS